VYICDVPIANSYVRQKEAKLSSARYYYSLEEAVLHVCYVCLCVILPGSFRGIRAIYFEIEETSVTQHC